MRSSAGFRSHCVPSPALCRARLWFSGFQLQVFPYPSASISFFFFSRAALTAIFLLHPPTVLGCASGRAVLSNTSSPHLSLPSLAPRTATMYFHVPLALCLLVHVVQSDASLLGVASESIVRAATHAHRHAAKRSAGLARDLRLSFRGILAADSQQQPADIGKVRVYCVNSASSGLTGNGTNAAPASGSATISFGVSPTSSGVSSKGAGSRTSAASGSPTPSTAASSPWKLLESYVSTSLLLPCSILHCKSALARQLVFSGLGLLHWQ